MKLYAGTQLQSFFFPVRNLTNVTNDSDEAYHFSSLILGPGSGNPGNKSVLISIYFFLQIFGGHVGVPAILLTLFLKKGIRRHPLLINFLVTWVLYATAFCLLLYLGKQFGPEPPVGLCLSQASLIYGAAVMCSSAGLVFVINIWIGLNALSRTQPSFNVQKWRDYLVSRFIPLEFYFASFEASNSDVEDLIATPYILFVVFTVAMAAVGSAYPRFVTREQYFFYCTINLQVVDLVPGCSGLVLICVMVFEALIGMKLYQMNSASARMKLNSAPPLSLIIRVLVFSSYSILSLLACIGFWSQQGDDAPYIIQASLPTVAFIVFGTQSDILETWGINAFWRKVRSKKTLPQAQKPLPLATRSLTTPRHERIGAD
ncbi:hypothetical protein A7U60_g6001 [Sanghuangporus baumii]|uniref:Uncharacterized protein n=1 Tax=Sanghuangporus baumii TaxID=108892 RepID=A0A9Q5HVL5_SANBA|nr:hypothetical protein A7U60_g6001 [Sanghuangporus baumii]